MDTIRLPDGTQFHCLNRNEALLLYADLFEERSYFQCGISLDPGDTVVDVGANVGLFALQASREAEGVRVVSLEPLPPIFSVLEANFALHHIPGVALPCGVGREDATVEFTFYPANSALSGRFAEPGQDRALVVQLLRNRFSKLTDAALETLAARGLVGEPFACRVRPLSDILREVGVERVGLLKVDVERAELDVLESLRGDDWHQIDQVVVEVHDVEHRLRHITELLREKGFEVAHRQGATFEGTDLYDLFASRRRRADEAGR